MTRKGGFKNIKLGKNVYRQVKRRGQPGNVRPETQPKQPARKPAEDSLFRK